MPKKKNSNSIAKDEYHEEIINASKSGDLEYIKSQPNDLIRNARCSIGCSALHWAAGSNQHSIVHHLLSSSSSSSSSSTSSENVTCNQSEDAIFANVDLPVESKLAKGRTALHYACRNGHLNIVKSLVEVYNANPHTRAKQGVTAFQLSVWQNQFDVCLYLVEQCGVIASEDVNDFGCGAVHWLGIVPLKRANFDDTDASNTDDDNGRGHGHGNDANGDKTTQNIKEEGSQLMPLAKWLTSQPNIDVNAKQKQGHTVLHKASWGGHLALVQYLHEEYGMYDDNTDCAGNYAADLCDMANTERHKKIALYLRRECSMERLESLIILGFDVGAGTSNGTDVDGDGDGDKGICGSSRKTENITPEQIRKAYLEKAKLFHPDAKMRRNEMNTNTNEINSDSSKSDTSNIRNNEEDVNYDFDLLRKAYEHLTLGGGISTKQCNPAHSINLLLEMQSSSSSPNTTNPSELDENDLFKARLLAVLLEYGDKGLNLSNIPKKWDQVWPEISFNSLFSGGKRKPGELLKMIKERAGDVVRIKREKPLDQDKRHSNKGEILVIPRHISRNDVLQYASDKSAT